MTHNVEETVEDLKAENLELKLDAIRKGVDIFKTDMHRHLDLILEQTSKTNGSVARAMEKIAEIEREDNKVKLEELKKMVEAHKENTKFWTLLSTQKWVVVPIVIAMYALTYSPFRKAIGEIFKIIF